MRTARLLLSVLALAMTARAQTWQAVVFPPAPGLNGTFGRGAGDRAFAGYGLPSGANDPAATRVVLFTAPATFRDVTPAGFRGAIVNDSYGRQHVGTARELAGPATHAFLWNGAFPVDLHPAGWRASEALGVGGGFQVGSVIDNALRRAAVWHGSAGSMQVLDSTGYGAAHALGTDGVQHVGRAAPPSTTFPHALLWNGIGPPIDLHPAGTNYSRSIAVAVDAGVQVGYVLGFATVDEDHAALWLGSAGTFREIHPAGWIRSYAVAVRGGLQAGNGSFPPHNLQSRALAWQGDAGSFVDLHAVLPSRFQAGNSAAEDVNARGEVVGWVTLTGVTHAVVWFR
jgi:hypothetical protein